VRGDKILWVNPYAGVAGDMFVGALLDLGLHLDVLREGLARLGLDGLEVDWERVRRCGISGSRYRVDCPEGGPGHRRWPDIEAQITDAGLPAGIQEDALKVFRYLFEAEARVHGSTLEAVHLHEAGGWDALADVVGACLGLDALGVGRILCGPVNIGRGVVSTDHGLYPVPAPAAIQCLEGAALFTAGPEGETATPTGAAIVGALGRFVHTTGPLELGGGGFVLEGVGYGAGERDPQGFANLLQVFLGRPRTPVALDTGIALLETNLDDCDPRVLGRLQEQLLAAGALDAWHTPVQMKKGRPGAQLSVLVRAETAEAARDLIFRETTTLGIRVSSPGRWVLERTLETVETEWGPVAVKVGREGEKIRSAQPEFEDCARLADRAGVPVKEVIRQALEAWKRLERRRGNEGTL
jgi:uncharacterized protein (TIGR00299 family) protein